ncbi:MAG: hypothetical protein VYA30_01985 [Myxococcota bacterium]|nr:hypothetical protein [Myxococcota bacterium]
MRLSALLIFSMVFSACDHGTSDGGRNSDPSGSIEMGPDQSATDGALDDGHVESDAVFDAGRFRDLGARDADVRSDSAGPISVETCADACLRYSACGRTDLYVDEGTCLAACERSAQSRSLDNWFECVATENCNLLQICRLPAPTPLSCAQTCGAVDECGGIQGFDCLSICGGLEESADFNGCGELLFGGACNTAGFKSCLGDTVFPGCETRCERGVECNVLRADGCFYDCIDQLTADDPLRAHRGNQTNLCISISNDDCRRIDQCVNPTQVQTARFNERDFCVAWNQCLAQVIPCEFALDEFVGDGPIDEDPIANCIYTEIRNNGCGDGEDVLFQCLEGPMQQRGPGCNELCEARDICGVLPEGEGRLDCVRDCNSVRVNGSADDAARLANLFPCGLASSCEELNQCLFENSPESACADHCMRLEACGPVAVDCIEQCDARFNRDRAIAYRACVRDAEGCDAIAECARPVELDCERVCERGSACEPDLGQCVADCDDGLYADFSSTLEVIACSVSAAVCSGGGHSWAGCRLDSSPGRDCARHCLALNQCGDSGPGALTDCLLACGDGWVGADAIRLAASRSCLSSLPQNAMCQELADCVPADLNADCENWCGELDQCDRAPAQCAASCPVDPLAQIRTFEQLDCFEDALDCNGLEQCIGDLQPVIGEITEERICQIWRGCGYGPEFGECEDNINGMPPQLRPCVAEQLSRCPAQAFEAFQVCAPGFDEPGNLEPAEGASAAIECRRYCFGLGQCGQLQEEQTIRSCTADCIETLAGGSDEAQQRLQGLLTCRLSLSCDALGGCLRVNSPEGACEDYCDGLAGCDLASDDCLAACDAGFYRARYRASRLCVIEAANECGIMADCIPNTPLPCQYACERLETCGVGDPNCVASCDDEHFEDARSRAAYFACQAAAPSCSGTEGVLACSRDANPGSECFRYCYAKGNCAPEDGAELGACLIACGEGYTGDERLRFEASVDCLAQADLEDCGGARDCLNDVVAPPCEPWCTALESCELANGCGAICSVDQLSKIRAIEQYECVVADGAACGDVQACLETGLPEAPGPINEADFCQQLAVCEPDGRLPCDLLLDVGRDQPGFLDCVASNLNPCPADLFRVLDRCGDGIQRVPEADSSGVCRRLCDAEANCGLELDLNTRSCIDRCISALRVSVDGAQGQLLACRDAISCTALSECEQAVLGNGCDAPCNQYLNCGGDGFVDLDACRTQCNANRRQPNARPTYTLQVSNCLTALLGDDAMEQAACAEQGLQCFEPGFVAGVLTCREICPQLVDCGIGGAIGGLEQCINGCEESDVQEPEVNAALRACITERLAAGECNFDAFEECFRAAQGLP